MYDLTSELVFLLLIFGVPLLAFLAVVNYQQKNQSKNLQKLSDQKYLAEHGQEAYETMLKERAANSSAYASAAKANTLYIGVWQTKYNVDVLAKRIENAFEHANIGQAPHRLSEFKPVDENYKIRMYGEWPYSKDASLSSSVTLDLKLMPQTDGGTLLRYHFSPSMADDPLSLVVIKMTSAWLEKICFGPK
jgi:hypothetical protein